MKTASTAAVHDLFMVFAFYHATGYEWFSGHPYIYLACLPAYNTIPACWWFVAAS